MGYSILSQSRPWWSGKEHFRCKRRLGHDFILPCPRHTLLGNHPTHQKEKFPSHCSPGCGMRWSLVFRAPWMSGSFLPMGLLLAPDYVSPFTWQPWILPVIRSLPASSAALLITPPRLLLICGSEPQTFSFKETWWLFSRTSALSAKESSVPNGRFGLQMLHGLRWNAFFLSASAALHSYTRWDHVHSARLQSECRM